MSSIEQTIKLHQAEILTALLESVPEIFAQNQIFERSKEAQIGLKEKQNSYERTRNVEIVDPEKQIEITADGKVEIKETAGAKSGGTAARILGELYVHVKLNKIGRLYTPDTMFMMGAAQRMPDVSFVAADKIPPEGEPLKKWLFAPDLAVEVVSP